MTKIDLSNLNMQVTNVEQGAKSARAVDPVQGTVLQFSSLMDVMNDDFAVMRSMEEDWIPTKDKEILQSVVEPLKARPDAPVDSEDSPEVVPETDEIQTIDVEGYTADEMIQTEIQAFDNDTAVNEEVDVWEFSFQLKEVNLDDYATQEATPLEVLPTVENVPLVIQASIAAEVSLVRSPEAVLEPTARVVPDVAAAQQQIVAEVVSILPKVIVEEEQEEQKPIEDNQLPLELVQSRERIDVTEAPTEEDVTKEPTPEGRASIDDYAQPREGTAPEATKNNDPNQPQRFEVTPAQQSIAAAAIAKVNTVAPQVATAGGEVGTSSLQNEVQQSKANKAATPKMPKKNFAKMLADLKESAAGKTGFSAKLLKRLELVIKDPAGTLDVEIAQDATGIHVKALMPGDVIRAMMGLEQDVQSALQDRGMELGSFLMEEKGDEDGVVDDTDGSASQPNTEANDSFAEEGVGGIFVNRRV